MEINQEAYADKDIVKKYIQNRKLEKGEEYIFTKYASYIDGCRVMDVGIGGGRTTFYLSGRAGEYLGIDFSDEFIKYCKDTYENETFIKIEWADARNLVKYQEDYFDFVLFSFNGLDYVSIEEREKILSEFKTVLKPGGILCFSFHNSGNIDKLYSFQMPRNPFKYYREWQRTQKIKEINGSKENYKTKDYFTIYDGGEDFRLNTLYIKPEIQKMQLEKVGFKVIEFCETINAQKLNDIQLLSSDSPWIYVIAQKNDKSYHHLHPF